MNMVYYIVIITVSKEVTEGEVTMKPYYKLTVTTNIPHNVEIAHIHAFCLIEVTRGRKWITFFGTPDDIVTAYDSLKDYGYMVKKTWLRK